MPNWTTAFFRLFSVLELMLLSATFTVEAGGFEVHAYMVIKDGLPHELPGAIPGTRPTACKRS